LLIWLVIGAIAAGQRGYYGSSPTNCAHAGNTPATSSPRSRPARSTTWAWTRRFPVICPLRAAEARFAFPGTSWSTCSRFRLNSPFGKYHWIRHGVAARMRCGAVRLRRTGSGNRLPNGPWWLPWRRP